MSLVRWAPRTELDGFARDPFFNRLFDVLDAVSAPESSSYPRLDLVEEKDRLVATVELPGIDPKVVEVHLQADLLTIRGERKSEIAGDAKVLGRETSDGAFSRTIQLPYRIQADKVKATSKNGLMTIVLPKADEFVGRQIQVETEK